ncbi:DUF3515 domain-containing protein [Brevibacterium casei]|mgnify:FL=1|uniref:DUF3515 domain-containing protein n=1 Tax=Brevibacterium casei TaxID=33889 RepID=A0A269ZDV0_9MICO|nr:DUF3515 domain-containing protein [Brevibacterium casei]MCT1447486.1 DUF3515 domain-containing protein [Brevibacterium casei]NNV08356.1 DUF3515 domain-containing protein [Geobacillus sp. MMMUD3]PAK95690.1 hypothetical protein B8X04_08025 [Brevibacterium casei]
MPANSRRRLGATSPLVRAVAAVTIGVPVLTTVLSGCAKTVIVEPAEDAANPKCADILLRLPVEVGGEQERDTSSQGTKAWGDPNVAVLRCGVTPPGPTTDKCVSVSGVDWVSKGGEEDDTWVFTSYGRTPAVEVLVNRKLGSGADVLAGISPALQAFPPERECVGAEDVDAPPEG